MPAESGGSALHDAARQAARDERDRLGVVVTDYVCGRLAEAVLSVVERRPIDVGPDPLDLESEELGG